jgi:hypothetical protein
MTECLEWTGAKDSSGYGIRRINGRNFSVHRLAWIEAYGPPPASAPLVPHRCDNPPCYLIDHLFVGTVADNVADREAKGRGVNLPAANNAIKTRCPAGHTYSPENTRTRNGKRYCKACDRDRKRESRARQQQEAA